MSETTDCPLCHGTFEVATAIGNVGCPAHFVEYLANRAALLRSSPPEGPRNDAGTLEPVEVDGPPFTDEQAAALGRRLLEHRSRLPITEVDTGGDL